MTKYYQKFYEPFLFALTIFFAGTLALCGGFTAEVMNGIKLWAAVVLPALFPYFFLTAVLSSLKITSALSQKAAPLTRFLFNSSGIVAYAFFISVISGYPVGAKIVSDLKEKSLIGEAEAERASAFCATSSPMFLVNAVGNVMFNDKRFGGFLLLCHLLSAVLIGITFSFHKRKEKPSNSRLPIIKCDNVLYDGVFSAVNSVLFVGGLITLFYLLTEVLLQLKILSPMIILFQSVTGDPSTSRGIVLGLFECTKGLKELSETGVSARTLRCAASICGFGGLSVIMQSVAFLKKAKIKTAPFLFSRVLSAVYNFIFAFILAILFL